MAEKLEAMVKLGLANSRMKNFFDIWLLSRLFSFEGDVLLSALENTFNRRRTQFPAATPFAFTPAFYEDPQKTVQWTAFVKKSKPDIPVGDLSAVIAEISVFLTPVRRLADIAAIQVDDVPVCASQVIHLVVPIDTAGAVPVEQVGLAPQHRIAQGLGQSPTLTGGYCRRPLTGSLACCIFVSTMC